MNTPRQTNLINPALMPAQDKLSPRLVVGLMGGALAVLILVCLAVFLVREVRESEVSALKAQGLAMRAKLGNVSPQVTAEQEAIKSRIAQTDQQINASRKLLSTLGQMDAKDGKEFSNTRHAAILNALSRFESNSLWLAKIEFDPEKALVELTGKTTNSNDIVAYLQFLSAQEEFRGMKFDQIDAHSDSKVAGLWVFSITNQKDQKILGAGK